MIWAIKDKQKIKATPKEKAICPICDAEVISKCGSIKVWHWSHLSNKDCDDWYEPESEWHKNWKDEFPKECQEFTMGRHRADIRTKNRWIIELQNSSISSEEIKDREEYYKRMVWLFNGQRFAKGLEFKNKNGIITFRWKNPPKSLWDAKKEIYLDIHLKSLELITKINRLKKQDKILRANSEEVYNEYNGETYWISDGYCDVKLLLIKQLKEQLNIIENKGIIFHIKKVHHNIPCGGWGELISKEDFINKFK